MGTLWHGGTIYTMKRENETIEAVYTEEENIIMTGSKEELEKRYADRIKHVENLEGAVLYPGFTDSHLHMIGLGETMLTMDLSTCETAEEMQELIAIKAGRLEAGEWLIGEGWNENKFPDRKIFHRQELDQLVPDNPMILTRVCRHAALANTQALQKASITKETPDPPGGMIVKDNEGIPTGYLLDQAADTVKEVMPPVTKEYLEKHLRLQ
ncbi:amidohydrolase family protein [Sinobaca sp. H24]|uniref:amidohydrolase family protein n=1 Tax=Sinobaca sp. H24 TaxID=2923376 RepID=UPI0027E2EBF2|nr:amidohydrolase family protein [Sinobaca sp. H24]